MSLFQYAPILTIVQNACTRLNLVSPQGVYDSQDQNAILLGSVANEVGPMLSDLFKWQQFIKEFEVIGDGVLKEFELPPGFSRFTDTTGWSHMNRRPVAIVNPQQWAAIEAWTSQSFFITPACRIFDDKLQFLVAPMDQERITFEYNSAFWVIDGTDPMVLKYALEQNSDVPMYDSILFTQALRIKWLEIRGMPTMYVQQDFNERLSQLMGKNQLANPLSLNGGNVAGFRLLTGANMPDTGFGLP